MDALVPHQGGHNVYTHNMKMAENEAININFKVNLFINQQLSHSNFYL